MFLAIAGFFVGAKALRLIQTRLDRKSLCLIQRGLTEKLCA
jgi:hypothetical protein